MLKKFYPYEYVESVFSIDYEELYRKGFRGLIFDIDNYEDTIQIETDEGYKNIIHYEQYNIKRQD